MSNLLLKDPIALLSAECSSLHLAIGHGHAKVAAYVELGLWKEASDVAEAIAVLSAELRSASQQLTEAVTSRVLSTAQKEVAKA